MDILKITKEQDFNPDQEYQYVCFNPTCSKKCLRFFDDSQMDSHFNCYGWITQVRTINGRFSLQSNHKMVSSVEKNCYDFKRQPLQSLFMMQGIFGQNSRSSCQFQDSFELFPASQNDPISQLKFMFNQMRIKIQTSLEKVFFKIHDRIHKIQQVKQKTLSQIGQILESKGQLQFSRSIQKSQVLKQYQEFSQILGSFTLIQEQKIGKQLNKIFQSVQNIGKSFWNTQLESLRRQQELTQKARKDLQKIHTDQTVHPAEKLKSLVNLYSAKNVQYQISTDKMSVSMKCWVCMAQFYGQGKSLKQKKASICTILTNHVISHHKIENSSNFMQKIMKRAPSRITYSQLIQEIEENRYDKFIIVDKENQNRDLSWVFNEKPNEKTFIMDVVSSPNQKLASGKYILANSQGKDSADILMVMIVYAIITSGYFRFCRKYQKQVKQKIILVSKDHFADTFKGILLNQFGVEIEVRK